MTKVQEQKLAERQIPEAADAAKIVQLVNDAIRKTRELARGLLPVVSEARGLMSALRLYATEVEDLFGIACRFQCEEAVLIHDAPMATHLYHIAQEAVNNAIKHGHAKNIVIRLFAGEREGTLIVRDDGVGIERPLPPHTGVGLHIMNYRAGNDWRESGGAPGAATRHDRDLPFPDCIRARHGLEEAGHESDQMTATKKSRVLVVDDHPIVRQGLALLINRESDLMVCGEAEDAQTAMQSVTTAKPDILVVDISLNGPDGLDLLKDSANPISGVAGARFSPCTTSRSMPSARCAPARRATS